MELGNKIFKGALWSSIEKISVQLVSFILGIILARILSPEEYGIFGLLIVFITVSQVFIDSGFSQALIQNRNRTHKDISTVLTFNIAVAFICYILLFIASPYIADFYKSNELKNLLRVLAFSLIINSLFTVPSTLLTIKMNFQLIAKITLISTLTSGIIAIIAAYLDYGAWSLVIQIISKGIISAIFFWFTIEKIPKFKFFKKSFHQLFSFGSKLLISSLLNTIVGNLNSILIGKYIGTKSLGFYTRGTQFSDMAYSTINSAITSVLLPSLSDLQDDKAALRTYSKTLLKMTSLITVPLFLCLSLFSEQLILLLLTEKWAMAIPIMQIFCIARLITILMGISSNMLYVIGRTDLSLKQQYVKMAIRISLLLLALPYGIYYVALAELLATVLHFFVNTYYPGKIFNYGAKEHFLDTYKIAFSGVVMVISGYLTMKLFDSQIIKLIIAIPISIISYTVLIKFLKIKEFDMLLFRIKSLSNQKVKSDKPN